MASVIYLSALDDEARGNIDFDTDTFKVMLVGSGYTENKLTHTKRSDVTSEVTGTGYTAGGASTTCAVTKSTGNNRIEFVIGAASWAASTITARKAVIYKSRGGASSADELVACVDFGSDVISSSGTFTLTASTLYHNNA